MAAPSSRLPPGQQAVAGFPRFGTHFHQPPPEIPSQPKLEIAGAALNTTAVPVADLAGLPRRELTADLHCVAGWSALDLRWEGAAFDAFYKSMIEPSLEPGAGITHLVFEGLDGYRAILTIEDALTGDVLIADRVNGQPLDGDHGAPARLVSPRQYGFMSVKHLCRIELHSTRPPERYHDSQLTLSGLQLVKPHQRARVWREERHRYLPAFLVRPIYRLLIPPIMRLSAHGGGGGRGTPDVPSA